MLGRLARGRIAATVTLCLSGLALTSCGTTPGGGLAMCTLDFSTVVHSSFGKPTIDGLLDSTARFNVAATQLDNTVRTACNNISTDLGGMSSEDTATACDNAKMEVQRVLSANASATLTAEYVPAVCTVDISAVEQCTAMCDASFDASATPPTCEGGMLSGMCSGTCMGSCSLMGSAMCTGSCSASCTGMCDATVDATCAGTCMGQCDGTCDAMDADGNCMGNCSGTCRGTCTGTIDGSCSGQCIGMCSGSCRGDINGTCTGECTGMCSVDFVQPHCEGGHVKVMANADCAAHCESDAAFDAQCTDPEVAIRFTGAADTADLATLVQTLHDNLPALITSAQKAKIMVDATAQFGNTLGDAVSDAASTSVEAADCVRQAIQVEAAAASEVNVSVMASVSVTATVSGG